MMRMMGAMGLVVDDVVRPVVRPVVVGWVSCTMVVLVVVWAMWVRDLMVWAIWVRDLMV